MEDGGRNHLISLKDQVKKNRLVRLGHFGIHIEPAKLLPISILEFPQHGGVEGALLAVG